MIDDEALNPTVAAAEDRTVRVEFPGSDRPSGEVVRDYRLLSKLGEGGMGIVFKAHEIGLDRDVALKMLSPKLARDAEYVQRFYREARTSLKLEADPTHCIVRGFAVFEENGSHYFAMEFIDGENLEKKLKVQGHFPVGDAVKIAIDVAAALHYAHSLAEPVYHRDIKPSNIMLTTDGKVKLTDLGLAKTAGDDSGLTQLGTMAGTPAYMAPEQTRNAALVDGRSDIYALGATLYTLLTGEKPFTAATDLGILEAKESRQFVAPSRRNADVPVVLDDILAKMMAPEPATRYQTAGAAARALAATGLASSTLSLDPATTRTVRYEPVSNDNRIPRSRSRMPTIAAVAVALAGAVVLAWVLTRRTDVLQTGPTTPNEIVRRGALNNASSGVDRPAVPAEPTDMILARAIDQLTHDEIDAAGATLAHGLDSHPDESTILRPLQELQNGTLLLFQYQTPEETSPIEPLWAADGVTLTRRDNYRFGIVPVRDCYIYVYQRDTRPSVTRIFPNPRYSPQANPIPPRQLTWLPGSPSGDTRSWMHLDTAIGEERFYFIALASALQEPDDFGKRLMDDLAGRSADVEERLTSFVSSGGAPGGTCFADNGQRAQVFRFNHK